MRTAKLILHTFVAISMVFTTLAIALVAVPSTAQAQVPTSIGYNGRLFNASGTALSGTYYFWFDLENTLSGGTVVTGNIQATNFLATPTAAITVTNGFFSVQIPLGTSLSDFSDNLFLELKVHTADVVGSAETLSPRVEITKTPYAIFAQAIEAGATVPTDDTFDGRLFYDTAADKIRFYDGDTWNFVEGITDTATLTMDNAAATAVNIGTGAVAKTVTIGNGTGATSVVLNAGTGAINIGTNLFAHVITLGNATGVTAVQIDTGSGGFGVNGPEFDVTAGTGAIIINDGGDAGSVTVEGTGLDINSLDFVGAGAITSAAATALSLTSGTTGAVSVDSGSTGAVNLGTGASAKTITLGNAASTEAEVNALLIDINGGTGGVTIDGGAASNFTTSVGALVLSTTAGGTSSSVELRSLDTSSDSIFLDADGAAGSGIYLDANSATNTTGVITLDAAAVSINSAQSSGITISAADSGPISIATSGAALSITGGGSNGTVSISSTLQDVTIETVASSRTISIGASVTPTTRTINVGTGTGTDTINFGDTTGSDQYNITSGETTNDIVDVSFASLTTADAFDIDTAALTSGDVFDITPGAVRTGGAAIHITDDSLAAAVTGDLIQLDIAGTKDTNTLDVDISHATIATTGNELDITYSGAAHAGNAIDLNMGTNVAGDALNITTATTSGQAIQVEASGALTADLVTVSSTLTGDTAGVDSISITMTASDQTNRTNALINGLMNASGTAAGDIVIGLLLDHAGTTAGTDSAIDIEGTTAWDVDLNLQNDLTVSNSDDNDLSIVENSVTLNLDFAETTAATIEYASASSLDFVSSANANDAININASAGGIDITSASGTDGEDIDITSTGTTGEIRLTTASTTADAVRVNASAGGIDIDANNSTLRITNTANGAADDFTIEQLGTFNSSLILSSAGTAADAIIVNASNAAGGIDVDFGTGNMVIVGTGVSADFTLDADLISIDSTGTSNVTLTSNLAGEDFTIALGGVTNSSLILSSTGTSTDALQINVIGTAGAMDVLSPTTVTFSGDTNASVVVFTDAGRTALVADFDGLIQINLGTTSSDEAICGKDADAQTSDVTINDCSASPVADYAERYPVATDVDYGDIVVPGDHVVYTYDESVGTQEISQAVKSSYAYQGPVIGIVSHNEGDFTSAGNNIAAGDNPMPVALVGRVPVKVVGEGGSIAVGDFLTTSSIPGAAMKATQAGRVIGMALSNWDGSSPTVMVQVINTWYQPSSSESSSIQGGSSSALSVTDSISVADGSFSGSVTIGEHLYGSQDMAGRVRLSSGKASVRVTFETAYDFLPIITFSSRSNSDSAQGAWISDEDTAGFTINRPNSDAQVEFNWIAIGVEDAQVTVSDDFSEGTSISVTDTNGVPPPAPVTVDEQIVVEEPAPEAPAPEPPTAPAP
ncbi:MAG: hypothetical protein WC654_03325 [Patescibacteria group bacterium]